MDFIQVTFSIEPYEEYICDVLASELGEIGFDSFAPAKTGIDAFIPSGLFNENQLKELLADFVFEATIDYKVTQIETKNWNEEWENTI